MGMLKTVLGTQEALDSWLLLLKVATFSLPAALKGKRFAGKGAKVHRVEMNHSGGWGRIHVGFGFDLLLNPKSRAHVARVDGIFLAPMFPQDQFVITRTHWKCRSRPRPTACWQDPQVVRCTWTPEKHCPAEQAFTTLQGGGHLTYCWAWGMESIRLKGKHLLTKLSGNIIPSD